MPRNLRGMPFPDEAAEALVVVAYRPSWPADFAPLASRLRAEPWNHSELSAGHQNKAPATDVLMEGAGRWAADTGWSAR